jgi:hypothetical protein
VGDGGLSNVEGIKSNQTEGVKIMEGRYGRGKMEDVGERLSRLWE